MLTRLISRTISSPVIFSKLERILTKRSNRIKNQVTLMLANGGGLEAAEFLGAAISTVEQSGYRVGLGFTKDESTIFLGVYDPNGDPSKIATVYRWDRKQTEKFS